MSVRKFFLLLIILPGITGLSDYRPEEGKPPEKLRIKPKGRLSPSFSEHWLKSDKPWENWPFQPKVAFSAEVISRTGFGTYRGKVYFSPPGLLRDEAKSSGEQVYISVLNPEKGKLYEWTLDPSTGKAAAKWDKSQPPTERPIQNYWTNVAVEASYWVLPVNIQESSLLKEEDELIDGVATTRYRAMVDTGREEREAYVWLTQEHGLIMRFEMTSTEGWPFVSGIELSNLKVGDQDPALFIPPADGAK
jgi:outer membrane lipoprotein-sorting protein